MQLPTRQSILSLSLLLSVASPAVAATSRAECVHNRAAELADLAACGDKLSIKACLFNLRAGKAHCNGLNLGSCFVDAGCTKEEAHIEAKWTIKRCDERPEEDFGDLRRRQKDDAEEETTKAPAKATPTPAKAPATSDKKGQTTAPAKTEAPKTSAAPTPANTPNTPAAASTSANAVTALSANAPSATSLTCSTPSPYTYNHCPIQSTGPESGKKLPCQVVATEMLVCADNFICRPEGCMVKDNTFHPAGIAIAIAFAAALAIAVGATCFFCCRERSQQKKLEKAAEAAAIAKAAAADKKRPSVAVRSVSAGSDAMPLMGGAPPLQSMPQQHGYADAPNPFGDAHQMR